MNLTTAIGCALTICLSMFCALGADTPRSVDLSRVKPAMSQEEVRFRIGKAESERETKVAGDVRAEWRYPNGVVTFTNGFVAKVATNSVVTK